MVDTRQFASKPRSDLLGRDGTLQANEVLQGRYRVTGVLGVGGMGAVYQARDLQFPEVERYVAIKEMHNLGTDEQIRRVNIANFEREANLLATLSHPAIPSIYDYFSIKDNRSYLVMEYIDGKNLEEILNSHGESIPIEMVVDWAIDLCDVIDYLHRHNPPIIFRDTKPANIMIDQYGRLRLIDFGIARTFQAGQKGTMIGTEGYSAPEQYKGEAAPSSDIYGIGATMHHVLTNHDPRLEPPFSFMERPIREVNPEVPVELESIVLRSLAFDQTQRFKNIGEMKQSLEKLRGRSQGGLITADPEAADTWQKESEGLIDVLWQFRSEEEIRSAPLYFQKYLFFTSYDYNLYMLDAETGKFRWKYASKDGVSTTPAVSPEDNLVVFGSKDHTVYGMDIRSGRPNWIINTNGPVYSSPLISHGHVFVGSDDGFLYAARVITGRVVWKYEAGLPIRTRPAVTDDGIIFGLNDGDVVCVDMSGQLAWRFRSKRGVLSSPLVYNGLVYFGSMDWNFYALDITNGWNVWQFRAQKPIVSSPVLAGQYIVFGGADGYVYALDPSSGREKWRFEVGEQVTSSPAYAEGAVYIGGIDGNLYCLNADNGSLRWKYESDSPIPGSPIVHDGVVYFGSTDHHIYALKA